MDRMRIGIGDVHLLLRRGGAGLVPDGTGMAERPVVVALHGGPGAGRSPFKPVPGRAAEFAQVVSVVCPALTMNGEDGPVATVSAVRRRASGRRRRTARPPRRRARRLPRRLRPRHRASPRLPDPRAPVSRRGARLPRRVGEYGPSAFPELLLVTGREPWAAPRCGGGQQPIGGAVRGRARPGWRCRCGVRRGAGQCGAVEGGGGDGLSGGPVPWAGEADAVVPRGFQQRNETDRRWSRSSPRREPA